MLIGVVFGHAGSTKGNAVLGPSAFPFFSRSETCAALCEEVIYQGTGTSVPKSTIVHSKHLGGAFAVPKNVIHSSGVWGPHKFWRPAQRSLLKGGGGAVRSLPVIVGGKKSSIGVDCARISIWRPEVF